MGTATKGSATSSGLKRPSASARSQGAQASSSPTGRQNAQEGSRKATSKARKKSGNSNWPRRSGRSGKSGWTCYNAKRKASVEKRQPSADISVSKKPSGRFVSKAVRADSPTFQSQQSQTDANFFLLSELPDAPYENVESEIGEFLDDEFVDFRNNSDDDGYWSPKAYSI